MTEGGETLTIQVVMQFVIQRSLLGMEKRKAEYLNIACQIYMAAILVVLPLYYIPGNGYYKLGDSKYYLYRNISLICIGICLVVQIIAVVRNCLLEQHGRIEQHRRIEQCCQMEKCGSFGMYMRKTGEKMIGWCREHIVVTAVCLYGTCAVVSALCSPYGSTALTGEREWYMGAVTICLMVGGFLLAANYSGQCSRILYLGEAASVTVALIGLLQKLGYDPLGLLRGYVVGDWEYTHMLTTLGNNNWLSGYYSVMFPLSLALFCKAVEERRGSSMLLGASNILVTILLFLQGSDGGVMVAGVALWMCFWSSRKKTKLWEALLFLLTGICVGMLLWGKGMQFLGTFDILLQDGIAKRLAAWQGWILLAAMCLLFCGIHHALPDEKKRMLRTGLLYGSLALAAGAVIWYILRQQGSNFAEWGNRRGRLWQMAWQGFCQGDLRQKLLGAGPDCFAGYLGQVLPGGTVLFDKGYFAGSIFTNAHNEWLTTLINMGVLGVVAYAAVFFTAFRKYRGNFMTNMLLFTYGLHSLISFQQVLNAPLFFLLLGICEAGQGQEKLHRTGIDEESIEIA